MSQAETGFFPPDTNGEIGTSDYVQLVNIAMSVYARDGTRLAGPISLSSLWSGFGGLCENGFGDPVVLYDQLAGRWLVSQLAGQAPSDECVAVSQTSDPLGQWYRYAFPFTGHVDYPKIGVWPDGYYMSTQGSSGATGAVVLERAAMLLGQDARYQYFDYPNLSLLPPDLDGSTQPPSGEGAPFVDFSGQNYEIHEFKTDWTTPANSTFDLVATLPSPLPLSWACVGINCVPQPGTSQMIANNALRLMNRAAIRVLADGTQHMLVTQTADADVGHNSVRWNEFVRAGGVWSIDQSGTYAPDADHRFTPSGAMDRQGDIAIGYSVSSSTTYPSIRYAVHQVGDPAGSLRDEGSIVEGTTSSPISRWGDYSDMTVDPLDDCTFWYTNEYVAPGGGWATRIASFRLDGCVQTPVISIKNKSVLEGNAGVTQAVFPLTLSTASASSVSVDFATADGTAKAGSDYDAASGTVTFAPGETKKAIPIAVEGDTLYEANERFTVNLTNPGNATIGAGQAVGTIKNDDPMPSLSISDASIVEGNSGTKQLKFTLSLSAPSGLRTKVSFATADGTATAGSDYVAKSGTVSLAAGQTSKTLAVTIVGDKQVEPDETFVVNLINPIHATISDAQGVGTIINDD